MQVEHIPVLLEEVLDIFEIKSDGIYIDGTFGRGGHAKAIVEKLGKNGRLIGIDKDITALEAGKKLFQDEPRVTLVHGTFAGMGEIAAQQNITGKIDGILLDLGVSSPQLDTPERGFSFLRDGPLDMRMDVQSGVSAAEWLNTAQEADIAKILKEYGEERYARRIAKAIVRERPIETTGRLASVVSEAHPAWEKHKHPATRVFQAIRIFINNELDDLDNGLEQCLDVLAVGGRLAVISFHSLEDRIVKRYMRQQAQGGNVPLGVPVREAELAELTGLKKRIRIIGRAVKAGDAEVNKNPRARSAVLRVMEKII